MPLRWKTSGLLGSRRANAATNRQSAANRALISRLLGVNRPFIGCEGARQRFTQVAEPFADPFLLGDVTVTYDHVQPRLARRLPRARLRGGASHEAEGRRGARGGGAGRVRAPAGRLRLLRQRGDELIPDRYVRRGLASWYGDAFDGKPTASGEPFGSNQFTTAHYDLPFDSRVRVRNLNNDREVELRVNDPVPQAPLTIVLSPRRDCWVSLRVDGASVVRRVMRAGEREFYGARTEIVLNVGDAGAFAINQRAGRALGASGQVVTVRMTPQNYDDYVEP